MSSPVSRATIIGALLKKEFIAYSRDLLYLILSLAMLVIVVVLFWVIPSKVDESFTLAVTPSIQTIVDEGRDHFRSLGATDEQLAALDEADLTSEEGLELVEFATEADMVSVVSGELEAWQTSSGVPVLYDPESEADKPADAKKLDVMIGIAFPGGFIADTAAAAAGAPGASPPRVTVYSNAAVPVEYETAMQSFVRELAFQMGGVELPVTAPETDAVILGTDRLGDQFTMRDRLVPILALMILLMETFSMSSLISVEVLRRTVTAVLVTPARVLDFLVAKSVFGTGLAFAQGTLVLALVGAFTGQNWLTLVVIMLIGSMMFTGIAMLVGSAGKDFIGQLFYTMMMTVPLLIPAFAVLIPGSTAPWVQVLPTYPLINSLIGATLYEQTLIDMWQPLLLATGWLIIIFGTGLFMLSQKVRSL